MTKKAIKRTAKIKPLKAGSIVKLSCGGRIKLEHKRNLFIRVTLYEAVARLEENGSVSVAFMTATVPDLIKTLLRIQATPCQF